MLNKTQAGVCVRIIIEARMRNTMKMEEMYVYNLCLCS